MIRTATVVGEVRFRVGEGPMMAVPQGLVEFEMSPGDVTLSWEHDSVRGRAAMPKTEFARYLAEKQIVLH